MGKGPRAARKLDQCRFFLRHLRAENQKKIGKDPLAVEAYIGACLGATKAAFYRLEKEVGKATLKTKRKQWREKITQEEATFFNWMIGQRDLDVHIRDPDLSAKEKWVPAHLVSGVTILAPPDLRVPNPQPGGLPHFAPGWVGSAEYYLGSEEATKACERFLELMERLVNECGA